MVGEESIDGENRAGERASQAETRSIPVFSWRLSVGNRGGDMRPLRKNQGDVALIGPCNAFFHRIPCEMESGKFLHLGWRPL